MATIIDDKNLTDDLSSGKIISSEVTTPNNVRFTFAVTNGTVATMKFIAKYYIEGARLLNAGGNPIEDEFIGNGTFTVNYLAMNGTSLYVHLVPVGTNDADVTVTTVES